MSEQNNKLISILVAVYNREDYILRALNSIPVRDDIEIIVANDGSTDNTLNVIIDKFNKQPIKLLNFKENHGIGFIRNKLVAYSTGKWICWLDSDDYFKSEISKVFDLLHTIDKSYNKVLMVNHEDNHKGSSLNGTAPWSRIYKREVYEFLKFPEIRSAEDGYFEKKLSELKYPIKEYKVKDICYHYNYPHDGSLYDTKKKISKQLGIDSDEFYYMENPDILKEYANINKIDVVVTYLNSDSENWKNEYNKGKDIEINEGKQSKSNSQAFGVERIRNFDDAFKYGFRGIENCIPWIRYVHLICYDEEHVPEGLDKNNTKLKIHYHRDFMPEEYLPCFDAIQINSFISNVSNLSEWFIHCDDDFYFINKVSYEDFFDGDTPKMEAIKAGEYKPNNDGNKILNSTLKFYKENISNTDIIYKPAHLPYLRNKTVEQDMIRKYLTEPPKSKFRYTDDIYIQAFSYIWLLNHKAKKVEDFYKGSSYVNLNYNTDYNKLKDKKMVCFNDTQDLKNYEETNKRLNEFLASKFPNKCSFEL